MGKWPAAGRRGGAGHTVLTLLVTLLIALVALMLASRLMLGAQRRSFIELRRALDPAVPIALKQLRADVMAAGDGTGDSEQDEPLTLLLPSGRRIAYELSGSEIMRSISEPAGQRVFLTGVRSFRWWWLGGAKPLVRIELTYEMTRRSGPEVAAGRRVFAPRGVETQTIFLTLRGGGGVGW